MKYLAKHSSLYLTAFCLLVLVAGGCATRYESRDVEKSSAADAFGDVVIFQSAEELTTRPLTCLGVLPLTATQKQFEPTHDLRKALHAYLAPTGVALVPIQKIDQVFQARLSESANLKNISKVTQCDTLLTGEITERQTRFLGVYSEIKIAASVRITRVSTGAVIWRAKHTAVVRDGGVPVTPISLIGGSISAGMNLRDEQITRTANDLARRLVMAIPNLKYTDRDSDLIGRSVPASETITPSVSVYNFISSVQDQPNADLMLTLSLALKDKRWRDPKDILVLSEFILGKDPQHPQAMFANATARLENGQPKESLAMAERALSLSSKDPALLFLKGRALLQLNQPLEATQALLEAAGADGSQAVYFTALGLAYNQLGQYEFALASLTHSLEMQPDNPYVLMHQAIAYIGTGDEAEAVKVLKKSMVLSIIANDHRNAIRALGIFKSLDLSEHIAADELMAYETKINSLLTNPETRTEK